MSAVGRGHRLASQDTAPPAGQAARPSFDPAEAAAYIGALAAELVELAKLAELGTLAYLADMVRLEAEHQSALMAGRRAAGQVSDTRPPGSR